LNPDVVATGHGVPLRGERMRQELHELARNFDAVARPTRGRYAYEPALAGVNGVFSVPPAGPLKTILIGAATLLAVSGVAALVLRERE
ncbi:MAG TPA: hypothetical protein VG095_05675, partial [Chthoniobacterales bacterium]|nr:hypothetical protein [Chthoniobacterales bacterium]